MSRRRQEEFYCATSGGGCESYFLTWLRDDMTGEYVIECPGCKHHHFRRIKDGLVTGDRHSQKEDTAEIIMGLKSTLRKKPYHNDPIFRRNQLKAYNGGLHV